jgi:hypothetical protein
MGRIRRNILEIFLSPQNMLFAMNAMTHCLSKLAGLGLK